jgi:hypothetical protein
MIQTALLPVAICNVANAQERARDQEHRQYVEAALKVRAVG